MCSDWLYWTSFLPLPVEDYGKHKMKPLYFWHSERFFQRHNTVRQAQEQSFDMPLFQLLSRHCSETGERPVWLLAGKVSRSEKSCEQAIESGSDRLISNFFPFVAALSRRFYSGLYSPDSQFASRGFTTTTKKTCFNRKEWNNPQEEQHRMLTLSQDGQTRSRCRPFWADSHQNIVLCLRRRSESTQ